MLVGEWGGGGAAAQTHVTKKPETVVRAVGVYEWTGELPHATASRFVPVTVFIDGQLQDAGLYLARPVPFALDTGTVFEVDQSGKPEGTLELAYSRHYLSNGVPAIDDGWLGYGAYKAPAAVKEAKPLRAGKISPVEVIGGKGDQGGTADKTAADSGRPTLTRKTDADQTNGDKTPDTKTAGAQTSSTPSDPDRPTMTRRPGSDPDTNAGKTDAGTAATDAGKDDNGNDPERPTLRKRTESQRVAARKESDSSSVKGVGNITDDPDRPNLHRGKPVGRMDEDELPPLKGIPTGMQQRVAVSDAKNRPPHDFSRLWESETERVTVLGEMQTVARAKLAGYNEGVGKNAAAAAPSGVAGKPAGAHASGAAGHASKPAAAAGKPKVQGGPVLSNEDLKGYTLSYGGAATYVYTATSAGADGVPRYVTVVAQREPNGELKIALSSVTDAGHLDRTPWMRLVDAVDVEASNRASLLMELRGEHSRQFALYRVIGAQAEERFVTETP